MAMRLMGGSTSSAADSAAGTAAAQWEVNHDVYLDSPTGTQMGLPKVMMDEQMSHLVSLQDSVHHADAGMAQPLVVRRPAPGQVTLHDAQEEKLDSRSRRTPPNAPKQPKQQQLQSPHMKANVDEEFVNRVVTEAVREVYESVKVETSTWQTSIMHLTDAVAKLTRRLEVFEVKVEDIDRIDKNHSKLASRLGPLEEEALKARCRSTQAVSSAEPRGLDSVGNTLEQISQLAELVKLLEESVSSLRQNMGKMRGDLQENAEQQSYLRQQLEDIRQQASNQESRVAEATKSLAGAAAAAAAEAEAAAEAAAAAAASTQAGSIPGLVHWPASTAASDDIADTCGAGGSIITVPPLSEIVSVGEVAQHVAQLQEELRAERADRNRALQSLSDVFEASLRHTAHDLRSDRSGSVAAPSVAYQLMGHDALAAGLPTCPTVKAALFGSREAVPLSTSATFVPVVHATGITTPGAGGDGLTATRTASPACTLMGTASEPARCISSPLRIRPPRAASPVIQSFSSPHPAGFIECGSTHIRSLSPLMPAREASACNTGGSVRTLSSARDVIRVPAVPASISVGVTHPRSASSNPVGSWVSPVATPPVPGAMRGVSPTGMRVQAAVATAVAYTAPATPEQRGALPRGKPPPVAAGVSQPLSMRATMPARVQHMSLLNKEAVSMVGHHQTALPSPHQ